MNKKELPINQIVRGDSLAILKSFPQSSIDMCMTSPPYWGLRDYGVEQIFGGDKDCEHEWNVHVQKPKGGKGSKSANVGANKNDFSNMRDHDVISNTCLKCHAWKGQLGLEPTPELFIEHLTKIFNEVKRVLKKSGTLWLNIGDTYASTPAGNPGCSGLPRSSVSATHEQRMDTSKCGLPQKCLCMIPERLSWSLIQNGWILRNKNIWYKPNGMPSSVKDRFSNKWEYVFMFSKSKKYYFDLDAVLEPYTSPIDRWGGEQVKEYKGKFDGYGQDSESYGSPRARTQRPQGSSLERERNLRPNPDGKNPGDVFEINTQPFPEAHFAVFPEKLCEKPIKAGCPENGILLDPFCGAGTALYVAKEMRRRYVGIDVKREYVEMAEKRLAQGVL